MREGRILVNDTTRLNYYFNRTLKCYPKATFCSIYSPGVSAFWKEEAIKKATADFIRKKGKMKHIILVRDAQEQASPDVQSLVSQLKGSDVEVHFVNSSSIAGDLKKNFIVESKGRIAWELHENGGYLSATATTNTRLTTAYYRDFEKLWVSKISK